MHPQGIPPGADCEGRLINESIHDTRGIAWAGMYRGGSLDDPVCACTAMSSIQRPHRRFVPRPTHPLRWAPYV